MPIALAAERVTRFCSVCGVVLSYDGPLADDAPCIWFCTEHGALIVTAVRSLGLGPVTMNGMHVCYSPAVENGGAFDVC